MRHFLSTADWSRAELEAMLERARAYRAQPFGDALARKSVALVFFNPSLRTRASFQIGVHQLGGQPVVLEPGASSWPMEMGEGVVMDGVAEEHAIEAVQVLARYFDVIAVRAFPRFQDWSVEREDPMLAAFARHSTVPVVNMETIIHPCQELALMMMLQDRFKAKGAGDTDGKTFLLSWAPHPKPLNTAVANSALMIAAKFGFNVRLLIPEEAYRLDPRYMDAAAESAAHNGRTLEVTTDIEAAYDGADVVYAKSWGSLARYGDPEAESAAKARFGAERFMVDAAKMARTHDAVVSHCLPMRRNVKLTDEVADSPAFGGIDEAENRLHVQKAMMTALMASDG